MKTLLLVTGFILVWVATMLVIDSDLGDKWNYTEPMFINYISRWGQFWIGFFIAVVGYAIVVLTLSYPEPWRRKEQSPHVDVTKSQSHESTNAVSN